VGCVALGVIDGLAVDVAEGTNVGVRVYVADGVSVALGVKLGVRVFVGCAVSVPATACATSVPMCAVAVPLGVEEMITIGVEVGRMALGVADGLVVWVGEGTKVGVRVYVADGVSVALGVKLGVSVFVGCAVSVPSTACATCVPKRAVAVPFGVEEIIAIGVDVGRVAVGVMVAGWV
jgi:hypothetical protein